MNAPVPPTNEMDSQKISNQYQSSYDQGFSAQGTLPAEQQEMPQEALQSGKRIAATFLPFHSFKSVNYYNCFIIFFYFFCSWPFPFSRPRYSICRGTPVCISAALGAGHRVWAARSVLLQQQSNATSWTQKSQRGFERLPWTIKWI